MRLALLLLVVVLGCTEPTEPVVYDATPRVFSTAPNLSFTLVNFLRETQLDGQQAYWCFSTGIIQNNGKRTVIGISPELRLYFTKRAFDKDYPDLVASGNIGKLVSSYFPEEGLSEIRYDLKAGEQLEHFTKTEVFLLPAGFEGFYYRFTFGEPTAP